MHRFNRKGEVFPIMKKRTQNINMAKKVSEAADIPSHLISGTPMISIIDNNLIHIENYGNIVEFREDILSFKSKRGITVIKGTDFEITSFTINNLDLKGVFKSVELDYEGDKK